MPSTHTVCVVRFPFRIALLEDSVGAIQRFLNQSEWEPVIDRYEEQGSWAHDTIIKPVDGGEFDADLLVLVQAVDGWEAKDYVESLRQVFADSSTYEDKVKAWDYCITITYAGERKIDVAPCVVGRQSADVLEVCNRKVNQFERSEPIAYTDWLIRQNALSGGNSFRKVSRLLKYLRDIKTTFTCPSVLLTTLLGYQIFDADRDTVAFADVPTSLRTLMGRLDDNLQQFATRPTVPNPYLTSEDFGAVWSETQYANFRAFIHKYRGWVDDAFEAETLGAQQAAFIRSLRDIRTG